MIKDCGLYHYFHSAGVSARPFPRLPDQMAQPTRSTPSAGTLLLDPPANMLNQAVHPPSPLPAAPTPPPGELPPLELIEPAPAVTPSPASASNNSLPGWARASIAATIAFAITRAAGSHFDLPPTAPFSPLYKYGALYAPFVGMKTRLDWAAAYRERTGWARDLPYAWPALVGLAAAKFATPADTDTSSSEQIVANIAGIDFNLNDFCRHWLITGKTGSAKTQSGIVRLLHELCRRVPAKKDANGNVVSLPWGGAILDAKGDLVDAIRPIFKTYGREDDMIVFATRPHTIGHRYDPALLAEWQSEGFDMVAHDTAVAEWQPKARLNLLGDDDIPATTYAQILYDVARAMGGEGGSSNPFFPMAARDAIASAIHLCRMIAQREAVTRPDLAPSDRCHPKLDRIYLMLRSQREFKKLLVERGVLQPKMAKAKVVRGGKAKDQTPPTPDVETNQFEVGTLLTGGDGEQSPTALALLAAIDTMQDNYFGMEAKETFDSIRKSVLNWLNEFQDPDILEVFAADTTHYIRDMDRGKILAISVPQRLQSVRRFISTIIKELCYFHGRCRFDLPEFVRQRLNLTVILQDEFQDLVTESDSNADKLRAARMCILAATQGMRSLYPVLAEAKAKVLGDNMCNRLVFACNSQHEGEQNATLLGKREVWKTSHSNGSSGSSTSRQKEWKYFIEPDQFRAFRKYHCVVYHADGAWRRAVLPVLAPNGQPARFFMKQIRRINRAFSLRFRIKRFFRPTAIE